MEILSKTTKAYIDQGAQVSAGGTVTVKAESSETMLSVAATLGVADTAGIAVSLSIADVHTETDAYLGNGASVQAGGAVSVSSTSAFKTTMIAGAVGAASSAGIGVANTTLAHSATTRAYVGPNANVTAGGSLSITATASEDLLTIAAGFAGGGEVGVAGSATVNVLSETTTAYVGPSSTITTTNNGNFSVAASDTTSVISVAGSLAASGEAGVGVGADVGVYTKHTNAYIDSGVTATIAGSIIVDAESSEELISVSAGIGAGTVGVAANAGVHVFNLTTRAFIGDDPTDPSGAGPGNVHAAGSVGVSANDDTDINEIVAVLAAGGVGVGAAAGVDVMTKDTESFIGQGANVTGDGNGSGITVYTGQIDTGSTSAPTFQPGSKNVGIETSSGSTLSAAASGNRSSFQSAGQVNTPQISQMDIGSNGSSQSVSDPSLSGRRTTSADTQSGFHGVAIGATNRDEVRTYTFAVAGGGVAVAVSAGVDDVNATTKAYIGNNATINASTTGASGSQSVIVGASDDFYHLSVAGSAAFGGVGVGPAVAVNVLSNTTDAQIGNNATVNALGDIIVQATGTENVVMIGFGVAAGAVGVGATVGVLSIDNQVLATIGDSSTVYAGADVFVSASDNTHVLELSGALAAGAVGVGGAVGVMTVTKDTEATIGTSATVDALGNGSGIAGIFDGTITSSPQFETTTAHGVIVQAQSSESITNIVAAGAGGFVGVSGAVGVTLINAETDAVIGSGANIDGHHQGSANGDQSVYVNAADNTGIQTYVIGIGAGFVGVSGAVDVGTLNDDTEAQIDSGASVAARNNVEVNAVALKNITGFDASGAGGFVGVGGAVNVWSVGTTIQKTTKDNNGNDTASAVDSSKGSADDNAAGQAQSGTALVTNSGGNSGGGINDYTSDGTGNPNTNTNRINAATKEAASDVNAAAPTQSDIEGLEDNGASTPPGTSAIIQQGATVTAGNAIGVTANESDSVTVAVGQVAAGFVGAGASVAILSLADNVTAFADGTLSAGGNISISANLNENVQLTGLDGSVGFVGIGAAVDTINDSSLVQASVGSITKAGDVTVSAVDTRNLQELTGQVSAGAVGAGASYTRLDVTGGSSSTVDGGAQIGQSGTVNSLTVTSNDTSTAQAHTVAVSAGIGAFSADFAYSTVNSQSTASIGKGAKVTVAGGVTVSATATPATKAQVDGVSVGAGLGVGASLATASTTEDVAASIGDSVVIGATLLSVTATLEPPAGTNTKNAYANALAGGGGILAGVQGSVATATTGGTVSASVGNNVFLPDGDVTITASSQSQTQSDSTGVGVGFVGIGIAAANSTSNVQTSASLGTA